MSLTLNAAESSPLHLLTHEEGVRFPEGALPQQSPVYTRNSLVIAASPGRLFAWLLAAPHWPEWYGNAKDVRIAGDAPLQTLGAEFSWVTFGVRVHTRIEELVPGVQAVPRRRHRERSRQIDSRPALAAALLGGGRHADRNA